MARVQADDSAAFAELYDRYAARGFRVACAICRDVGQAEDVVQEGFLTIWRSRSSYQPEMGKFGAWSMKVVQNRAIDSYRGAASRPPPQKNEGAETPELRASAGLPEDEVITRGNNEELVAVMKRLPAAQVQVIVLAFFGELSHSEIAAQLNLPKGTVKGRMRLGLEKLRHQMNVSN